MENAPQTPEPDTHLTLAQIRGYFPGIEPSRVRPAAEKCLSESGLEAAIAILGGQATATYPVELLRPIARELRVPLVPDQPKT